MLNRSASHAISTSVLKALPDKLGIKRHSPSIDNSLFFLAKSRRSFTQMACYVPDVTNNFRVNIVTDTEYIKLFISIGFL